MSRIWKSKIGKIAISIAGLVITVLSIYGGISYAAGARDERIQTLKSDVYEIEIQLPPMLKDISDLKTDVAVQKNEVANVKEKVNETNEMVKEMYRHQFNKPYKKGVRQ